MKKKKLLLFAVTTVLLAGIHTMSVSATEVNGNENMDIPEETVCEHTYEGEITTAATCTEAGVKTFTCSKCGDSYPEEIPVLEHSYKTTIKKATISQNGSVITECDKCGEEDTEESYTIYRPESIKLSKTSVAYTGKAIKPTVSIMDKAGKKIEKTHYTVTYKNNKNVGKATVTVKFEGNYYSGKLSKTFTINPKSTSINTIKAEENGFSVKWKKQTKQITGYQIQYATKKNFKNAKSIWVKNYKTADKKISDLQEKTKYYVRVRTYKEVKISGKTKKFYSAWSSKKAVTTAKKATAQNTSSGNVDRTFEEVLAYASSKYPMFQVIDNGDGTFSFYDIVSHNAGDIPEAYNSMTILDNAGFRMNGHISEERLYGSDGYAQWTIRGLNVVKN